MKEAVIRRRRRSVPKRIAPDGRRNLTLIVSGEVYNVIVAVCERHGQSLGAVMEEALLTGLGLKQTDDERLAKVVEAAVERALARRDPPVEPLGSPPPAYQQ